MELKAIAGNIKIIPISNFKNNEIGKKKFAEYLLKAIIAEETKRKIIIM